MLNGKTCTNTSGCFQDQLIILKYPIISNLILYCLHCIPAEDFSLIKLKDLKWKVSSFVSPSKQNLSDHRRTQPQIAVTVTCLFCTGLLVDFAVCWHPRAVCSVLNHTRADLAVFLKSLKVTQEEDKSRKPNPPYPKPKYQQPPLYLHLCK